MPERDELDRLIDSALANYAEPRPGIEQRILARVEASRTSDAIYLRWPLWAMLGLVTSCIVLIFTFPHARQTQANNAHPSVNPEQPYVATRPKIAVEAQKARSLPHVALRLSVPVEPKNSSRGAGREPLPKLDVFPAPKPLDAEEQRLIRFATETPDTDRTALVEAQQQITEPLRINAIHIPPLPSTDKNQN